MSTTIVVLLTGVLAGAALLGIEVLLGTRRQLDDAADPIGAEHWLVTRLAERPKLRALVEHTDRRVAGGFAVAISLLMVFAAALAVGWMFDSIDTDRGVARWDQSVAAWGPDNSATAAADFMRWVTNLGDTWLLFSAMVVVGIIDWRRRRNAASIWFLLTVGLGVTLVNNGLKLLIMRERPPVEHLVGSAGSSFPSGHAAAAAACWMAIALVAGRWFPRSVRPWLAVAAAVMAGLVAASRSLLGVHWVTDVVAGLVVGWTWFLLAAVIFGGRLQRFGEPFEEVAAIAHDIEDTSHDDTSHGDPSHDDTSHGDHFQDAVVSQVVKPHTTEVVMERSCTPKKVGVVAHAEKSLGGGLEQLRSALADSGHADPPWYEVSKSKKAPKAIRSMVEDDGVDRVLVWGGDGTVRRAIDTVISRKLDASIGILPAGTANLLASNLDIPIDLRAAVDIAVHGDPRPIDVGTMNGAHFAVMAGAGFDALMIRDAEEGRLKERFGKAGYVAAGIRNRDVSPAVATIEVDGDLWYHGDASCVLVANVGTILGGLEAFPDASPVDGRLNVGVVAARTASDWIRLMASATLRRAAASSLTEMTTARELTISFDRTLPWEVDGGDRKRTAEYEVCCVPQAIRICQPARHEPVQPGTQEA